MPASEADLEGLRSWLQQRDLTQVKLAKLESAHEGPISWEEALPVYKAVRLAQLRQRRHGTSAEQKAEKLYEYMERAGPLTTLALEAKAQKTGRGMIGMGKKHVQKARKLLQKTGR